MSASDTTLSMETDFPEVPANLWDNVAGDNIQFKSRFNEQNVFATMYDEAVKAYYADATDVQAQGRAVLELFDKWQPIAAEFTKYVLRGDTDNPLDANLDWDAEGAGEAIVRPLGTYSFSNASYAQTPGSTGQYNIIPDDSQADGSVESATPNEQAWLVFGYAEYVADDEVPYDYVQADINDNIGVRRPFNVRQPMQSQGTLKVVSRDRGPLMVEPGFDLDIDVNVATTGIRTGIWPLGIEVIRADATEFGGILDA